MFNSRPNNKNYKQGNFIPKNKDRVLKLNNEGGIYYRSGLEYKFMIYLDNHPDVIQWCGECISVPYQLTHFENGNAKIKNHTYYVDFFYRMKYADGSIKEVVVEVKPQQEYNMVQALKEGKLVVPEKGTKKLKNFEFTLKMAHKNMAKWNTIIEWCNKKGYEFIIITDKHLK